MMRLLHWDEMCDLCRNVLTTCTTSSPVDPHNLALRCLVNGEEVQSSNTNQMIFRTAALVAWISQYVHSDSRSAC